MGGAYVFAIQLTVDIVGQEYRSSYYIPASEIIFLRKFKVRKIYKNESKETSFRAKLLVEKVPEGEICKQCNGLGQISKVRDYRWEREPKFQECDICFGYGYSNYEEVVYEKGLCTRKALL